MLFAFFVLVAIYTFAAWTPPSDVPPAGNVDPPINSGPVAQQKKGNLALNTDGSFANGLLVPSGNVGIGTLSPTSKLHVIGKATITGGVDPPYVSFSGESHQSIRAYAKDVEPHEKAMMFWNADANRIEIYDISGDMFYTVLGQAIDQ